MQKFGHEQECVSDLRSTVLLTRSVTRNPHTAVTIHDNMHLYRKPAVCQQCASSVPGEPLPVTLAYFASDGSSM